MKKKKRQNKKHKNKNLAWVGLIIISAIIISLICGFNPLAHTDVDMLLSGDVPENLISKWAYGPTESISTSTNRLYANAGDVLMAFDTSNPGSMVKLKEISGAGVTVLGGPQVGQYIASNDKAIVICQRSRGATIVDATTFESVKFNPGGSITSAEILGDTLFLSVGGKLMSVDISSPLSPQILLSTNFNCQNMAGEGNNLYVNYEGTLKVYDVSNGIDYISSYSTGGFVWDIDVLNDMVYVVRNYGDKSYHSVHIIDVTNKVSMQGRGTYVSDKVVYKRITVMSDNLLIVSEHDAYIEFVDITDKNNPKKTGTVEYTHGYPRDVAKIDDSHFAVGVHYRGVDVFKMSGTSSATKTNYLIGTGRVKAGYVNPDTMIGYLLDDLGLRIVDFNYESTQEIAFFDWGSRGQDVKLDGDILYCAISWGGFKAVDVSDPHNVKTLIEINPYEYGTAIKLYPEKNLAYIEFGDTVKLYDTSQIKNKILTEISSSPGVGKGSYWGWDVDDNGYLYIAKWDEGLFIYDWKDRTKAPVFISKNALGTVKVCDVIVDGNVAYLQDFYQGVYAVDVTTKQSSVKIGEYAEYQMNSRDSKWSIEGDVMYVNTWHHGVTKIDISTPSNMNKIGTIDASGGCYTFGPDYVGVIDGGGFSLFYMGGGPVPTTIPTTTMTTITTTTTISTTTTLPVCDGMLIGAKCIPSMVFIIMVAILVIVIILGKRK